MCNPSFGNPNHDITSGFGPGATATHIVLVSVLVAGSGFTSFDNFGESFLILFQIATVSTWYLPPSDISTLVGHMRVAGRFEYVYALRDSEYTVALVYPIVVFVLVSMVSASLFVAVITHGFSQFRADQKTEEQLKLKASKLDRKLSELANAAQSHDATEWSKIMAGRKFLLDEAPDDVSQVPKEQPTSSIVEEALQHAIQQLRLPPLAPKADDDVVERDSMKRSQNTEEKSDVNQETMKIPKQATIGHEAVVDADKGLDAAAAQSLSGSSVHTGAESESGSGSGVAAELGTLQQGDEHAGVEEAQVTGKPADYWDSTDSDESEDEEHDQSPPVDSCSGDGRKPTMCCRLAVYNLVQHTYFELFIFAMIGINVMCLATIYDGMSVVHQDILDLAEWGFTGIFTIEFVLKIFGLGPCAYFGRGSNVFDFILVATSIAGLILSSANASVLRMSRLARILRLIRVLRKSK